MSYLNQNVTPIDMLPELEDLERTDQNQYSGAQMLPPGESEKFGRYIRGSHVAPQNSGMNPYNPQTQQGHQGHQGQQGQQYTQLDDVDSNAEYNPMVEFKQGRYSLPDGSPSCIDVANHVDSCPICSKFYNNDKTVYIITIILLLIICILLLKKVLEG